MPILLYNSKTFHPVVIATSTIALQEQLLSDVERLKKWLRIEPHFGEGEEPHFCLQDVSLKFTIQVQQKKKWLKAEELPKWCLRTTKKEA